MSENIVLTSVNERGIAEVILNRPERNNAYKVESYLKKKFIKYKKEGEWYENLDPLEVRLELFQYIS